MDKADFADVPDFISLIQTSMYGFTEMFIGKFSIDISRNSSFRKAVTVLFSFPFSF
ncbi:MAG: hypothetical protein IK100_07105 [Muribaculaceae bacterium]|nr:hypothetical protein [Muribaculaceae bacterium]